MWTKPAVHLAGLPSDTRQEQLKLERLSEGIMDLALLTSVYHLAWQAR